MRDYSAATDAFFLPGLRGWVLAHRRYVTAQARISVSEYSDAPPTRMGCGALPAATRSYMVLVEHPAMLAASSIRMRSAIAMFMIVSPG
jgi:hypothetical protein